MGLPCYDRTNTHSSFRVASYGTIQRVNYGNTNEIYERISGRNVSRRENTWLINRLGYEQYMELDFDKKEKKLLNSFI